MAEMTKVNLGKFMIVVLYNNFFSQVIKILVNFYDMNNH